MTCNLRLLQGKVHGQRSMCKYGRPDSCILAAITYLQLVADDDMKTSGDHSHLSGSQK